MHETIKEQAVNVLTSWQQEAEDELVKKKNY